MKVNIKNHTMMYPAPAVMIAINSTHKRKTLKSILESRQFCIAFASRNQVEQVDYLGLESGYNEDKLAKINYTHKKGKIVNAPVIDEFKVSLECEVMHIVKVGSHTQLQVKLLMFRRMRVLLMRKVILFLKN